MQNIKTPNLKFFFVTLYTIIFFSSIAQIGCENADLENGSFQNWRGEVGIYNYPYGNSNISTSNTSPSTNGIVSPRHTIMTGNATDPNTCGVLPVVAPGSKFSARIGDLTDGYGLNLNDGAAERLMYDFDITAQSNMIIYKYAIVMENPEDHTDKEQPRFLVSLKDQQGNVVPCTEYFVYANIPNQGFKTCSSKGTTYSEWKTIGVDVSPYIGQTLTLTFTVTDCGLGGHFGYAYVDAGCARFELDTKYCLNTSGTPNAVVSAPEGFSNYSWTNASGTVIGNTPSINIQNPTQGEVVNCLITSVNGCTANLHATLTPSDVDASFTKDSVCFGTVSILNNTSIYTNAVLDSIHWSSDDGFSSDSTVFAHSFSTPGTYNVTMFVQTDAGCHDQVTQQVVVNPSPISQFQIADICLGQPAILNSQSTVNYGSLINKWVINETDTLIGSPLNYNFTQSDTATIKLIAGSSLSNCKDTLEKELIIFSNPTADFTFIEKCFSDSIKFLNACTFIDSLKYTWIYNGNVVSSDSTLTYLINHVGLDSIVLAVQDVHQNISCSDSVMHTFTIHEIPSISFINRSNQCFDSIAILNIENNTTIGSNETINYNWNLNNSPSATTTDYIDSVFNDGIYSIKLTATSAFGCATDSVIDLTVFKNPSANFTFTEECLITPVTFNSTSIQSGIPSYNWIYKNIIISNTSSFIDSFATAGIDSIGLIILDNHSGVICKDTVFKSFFVHDVPKIAYTNSSLPCLGQPFTSYNLSGVSTNENINYQWSIDGTSATTNFDFSQTFQTAGTKTLTLSATTDFGCTNDSSFTIEVHPIPNPPALLATTPICPGDNITFTATAEPNSTIQWSGPNNFNSQDFLITMPFNISDLGNYSAYVTSQFGCASTLSSVGTQIINIYTFDDFDFPNVITANNDGTNDVLDINGYFKTCDEYTLYIFNRWGNLVFEQTKNSSQFKGDTEDNKELIEGAYFYRMDIKSIDGSKTKSGYLHIVKD